MTQNNSHLKEEPERRLAQKEVYLMLAGFGLLALLAFLLFGIVSTDLDCSRLPSGLVECSYVQSTPLRQKAASNVLEPLAANVVEVKNKSYISYRVKLRSAQTSHTLPLLSAHDYNMAQAVANEVNAFLQSSNEKYFSQRFPEKRID